MLNIQYIGDKAIFSAFKILGVIPRDLAIQLGNRIGHMLFLIDSKHRKIAIDNLAHAFGDAKDPLEIRRLARRVFMNLAQVVFEIGWSLRLDKEKLSEYFKIDGAANLKKGGECWRLRRISGTGSS
jgi:KDO2-lipid IV(A) lauroyltransferase